MATADDYLKLITSEHRKRPFFVAVVNALMQGPADINNLITSLPPKFDLETAVGVQLDAVGEWVGITRRVTVPLAGVYFSWNDIAELGWDQGSWQGADDPNTGIVSLNDGDYRTLLRAKIAANNWDGTVPGALAAYAIVFPGQQITIIDNQDMTMDVVFLGPPLTAVERALILGDYLLLRPVTVQVHTYSFRPIIVPPLLFSWDDPDRGWDLAEWYPRLGAIFGWDTSSVFLGGWETADWTGLLLPSA